ncbi:MAG: hypothetical protein HY079_02565 [Elusimicrobia bacterium]|nr:hypothetical protein [Elusimicrobiota bacterium]
MNNKIIAAACAAAVLASAGAWVAALSLHAHASEAPEPSTGFTLVAQDDETRVYTFENAGHRCFLASTKGGSGLSLQCLK